MNGPSRTTGVLVALLVIIGLLALSGSGAAAIQSSTPTTESTPSASPSPALAGSPVASPAPGSGTSATCAAPEDGLVLPVESNPISNTSTNSGLKIDQVLVENNVDPETGGDAPDHLEIALSNESDQELSGFQVYYEITDVVTGAREGYCSELTGFTIAPGEQRTVHFDSTGAPDHFPDNEFSLYHSSVNEMQVDVTVSAKDVAPQKMSVTKEAGGDEDPND